MLKVDRKFHFGSKLAGSGYERKKYYSFLGYMHLEESEIINMKLPPQ